MPKYSYTVKDREGKTYKNVVSEINKNVLVDKLQKQDFFIINIHEINPGGFTSRKKPSSGKKKFSRKKVKSQDLLLFARQLATMLDAGVTLIRSLNVILAQIQSETLHKILFQVRDDVEQGISLSVALSKYPKVFDQFWVSLVEVGEASGTIPVVLEKLCFYIEQKESFKSTIISGIIYPAILFCVAMGAIVFFALFVGPKFESVFTQMNAELPLLTVWILALFNFMKTYFIHLLVCTVVFFIIARKYSQTYSGRLLFERFFLGFPMFGEIYRIIIVERFSSQMAILIDAGVPILYALDIVEKLVNNNSCALIVSDVREGVKQGELLVAPMERSGFFPPMAIQMIMVGEETGELSKMLKHVANYYQMIVETFMKRFATIIEPFMLVFMGAVIGVIVIAMFLPMFNIAQLGGG